MHLKAHNFRCPILSQNLYIFDCFMHTPSGNTGLWQYYQTCPVHYVEDHVNQVIIINIHLSTYYTLYVLQCDSPSLSNPVLNAKYSRPINGSGSSHDMMGWADLEAPLPLKSFKWPNSNSKVKSTCLFLSRICGQSTSAIHSHSLHLRIRHLVLSSAPITVIR